MGQRAAAALTSAGAEPVVMVGGDPAWAATLGLPLVADRWPGYGPVGGIATALSALPSGVDLLLVVACDQPWLQARDLVALSLALVEDPTLDVVIGRTTDGSRQPFPAAWRPTVGPALAAMVDAGERRLLRVIDQLSVGEVAIDPVSATDIDEPSDLPTPEAPSRELGRFADP